MRVLVTGATGFVGRWLVRHLLESLEDVDLFCLSRRPLKEREFAGCTVVVADLADAESLEAALAEARPELVYHLAAETHVAASWERPERFALVNVGGTGNLMKALSLAEPVPKRVVLASSAQVYGTGLSRRLDEDAALRPETPYAVTKIGAEQMAQVWCMRGGVELVVLRLFNHTGPGRPPQFAESSFARQVVLAERGELDKIIVGNLDAVRDFLDVRDVVRAYFYAGLTARPGTYNVCSGVGRKMKEVLEALLSASAARVRVVVDPELASRREPRALVGDPSKFMGETGWRPEIPFRDTMADLLKWWREVLGSE